MLHYFDGCALWIIYDPVTQIISTPKPVLVTRDEDYNLNSEVFEDILLQLGDGLCRR